MEEWMQSAWNADKYEVSSNGRVKNKKTGRILRPRKTRKGYLQIGLRKDGKKKCFRVHRLVWESFNGPIPEGMQINHINEDKTDNRIENLSLMTCKDNNNWGTRNKRISKPVEQYTLSGIYLRTWPSIINVERELGQLGFRCGSICSCCKGKQKTHKGYIWKYAI